MTTTRPFDTESGETPSYPRNYSKSMGQDASDNNTGNINKIEIDLGKSVNSIALCAVICGICLAITVGTVWHSKEREVETQARIRVLQNHIDENTALLRIAQEKARANR